MESWNHVINAALLGTEKRSLKESDVDLALAETVTAISEQTTDREEAFLQTAALVYNFRQCGFLPLHKEAVTIATADAEEKSYASLLAHAVLADVLETDSISLLRFWLEQCSGAGKIVQPEVIPALLNVGVKTKSLQSLVITCCGKRGEWLQQFNEEWQWYKVENGEELWHAGTLSQRKEFLASLRQSDPAKGRELLQQTWSQESAATKLELLELFKMNAGADDVVWLEDVLNEKSVKVKDAALAILKTIPSSTIVQRYWNILQQSIRVVTSKGLLGIGTKAALEVKLAAVDPSIFKTGIEQVSGQKGLPDEIFILQQLIAHVPPHLWETHFGSTKEKIISLFTKEEKYSAFATAIGDAAVRFKEVDWLREITAVDPSYLHVEALTVLPQKEAEAFAEKFLGQNDKAGIVLRNLDRFTNEWSLGFAKAVLRFTAKNPYQYHRGFYNDIAAFLPVPLAGELEKCTPKEEYLRNMWSNQSEYIIKLLTLKLQTLKAFNE
jgi:hypothetical protein